LKDKEVIVYDKFADSFNNLSQDIDQVVTLATDLENLLEVVDTVILCNGDSVYDYKKIPSDINVIDPWRIL
jgi:hypothetical protein